MTEQADIAPVPFTVDGSEHLTEEQARGYLRESGYGGEVDHMTGQAERYPEIYRYTADRHRYLAHVLVHGEWHWVAGDCTKSEERIKVLGRARRAGGRGR